MLLKRNTLLIFFLLTRITVSSQQSNGTYKKDSLTEELYSTKNPSAKVAVLQELAELHSADSGNYLSYLQKALAIAEEYQLGVEITNIHNKLGWRHLGYGNILAKKHFLQLLDVSQKRNDPEWMGEGFNGLGVYYYDSGDIKRSIEYYEEALENFEKAGFIKGFGGVHNNLGISYRRMGDAVKALEHHFLGLAYRQEYNKKAVKRSLYNIGNVFLDQERYFDAESYFLKALKLEAGEENMVRKARIYLSLGIIKFKTHENLKSLEFASQALLKFSTAGETEGKAKSNLLLGDIYLEKSSFDSAMYYYEASKRLLERTHFERIKLEWDLSYAHYLKKVDSIPKAREKLQNCLNVSVERDFLLLRLDALISLYELEKAANNFQTSLSHLEDYQSLHDSLQSLKLQNKIDLILSRTKTDSSLPKTQKSGSSKPTFFFIIAAVTFPLLILVYYLINRFYIRQVVDRKS